MGLKMQAKRVVRTHERAIAQVPPEHLSCVPGELGRNAFQTHSDGFAPGQVGLKFKALRSEDQGQVVERVDVLWGDQQQRSEQFFCLSVIAVIPACQSLIKMGICPVWIVVIEGPRVGRYFLQVWWHTVRKNVAYDEMVRNDAGHAYDETSLPTAECWRR